MSAINPNRLGLCVVACVALMQLPEIQKLGTRLRPPQGEGQRVCVAVGEKKVAYKFSSRASHRVDNDPSDSAKISVDAEPEGGNNLLSVQGLKPGKVIAHVTQLQRNIGKPEDFDRWFIITVNDKPTTDTCLCKGTGEVDCANSNKGNSRVVSNSNSANSRRANTNPTTNTNRGGANSNANANRNANSNGGGSSGANSNRKTKNDNTESANEKKGAVTEEVFEARTEKRNVPLKVKESKIFKETRQLNKVKVKSDNESVATAVYREGYGLTISGKAVGEATVTVSGEIVRIGVGIPPKGSGREPSGVSQENPTFTSIYRVEVVPKATDFSEEKTFFLRESWTENFNKKHVTDLKATTSNAGVAAVNTEQNALKITAVSPGEAKVIVRGTIVTYVGGGPGKPTHSQEEPFIITYKITVRRGGPSPLRN